ncbi:MAG: 50S ribosomal protein L11 methyltransferase [Cryomorphaceae bacterium]|nr:50S ribosomal protein L11 methyltransferase [Cryomorphaceae bacterium]
MDYIGLNIRNSNPETWNDIIVALLSEFPFESFEDTDNGVSAYIPIDDFESDMTKVLDQLPDEAGIGIEQVVHPRKNWNAEWESSFQPVIIDSLCCIYAPFHDAPKDGDFTYTMCIMPRMAFGTGHHSTTRQMIASMNEALDFVGESVLDMGCGTGVLGLFARMKGAKTIHAIDVDAWAVENTIENFEANKQQPPEYAVCGDKHNLQPNSSFGIILANINRNVLLEDIPTYVKHLKRGGHLMLSGFYEEDVPSILEVCDATGLALRKQWKHNEWMVLHLQLQ